MSKQTREAIKFILDLVHTPHHFFFWFFIRFLSALFPLIAIYLFSRIVNSLELKLGFDHILVLLATLFIVRTIGNFSSSLSISRLNFIISNTQFNIHNFLLSGLKASDKSLRHEAIQAIRNFSDAVRFALELITRPGIDSLVSLIFIPIALFFLDFRSFVITIAYIITHYMVDLYTTQHYTVLKNIQDARTENYYATLQETNRLRTEENFFTYQYNKLCHWKFGEDFILKTISVIFYSLILLGLIYSVSAGEKHLSDIVLIIGYAASTQDLLVSFSEIKDRFTDVKIALTRLSRSRSVSCIDLDDLI